MSIKTSVEKDHAANTTMQLRVQSQLQHAWLESTAGRYLLQQEQMLFDQAVSNLFGFNALQLGFLEMDLLKNSRIPNRYKSSEFDAPTLENHLRCYDDFLPFAEMSLDLLILPHRLEFSERPHQTLREAERVMMPEGHLLISGFNPISTWGMVAGLSKLLNKQEELNKKYPWRGQFIGLARMKDWLKLLGFEILSVEMACHVPPFEQASWHRRFAFLDQFSERCCAALGGVYFIVAKKRVVGMTPIKPNWKKAGLKSSLTSVPVKTSPSQSRPSQKKSSQINKIEPKSKVEQ